MHVARKTSKAGLTIPTAYLPMMGESPTMAQQIQAAVNGE